MDNDKILILLCIIFSIGFVIYTLTLFLKSIFFYHNLDLFDLILGILALFSSCFVFLMFINMFNNYKEKELHCIDMNDNELIVESCSTDMSCVLDGKRFLVKEYWEVIKEENN